MPNSQPGDQDQWTGHEKLYSTRYEEFYRDSFRPVVNAAFVITGDAPAAEDAAQEAFLEIWRAWGEWVGKPWGQMMAHARMVAIRRSIDGHRRRSRFRTALDRIGAGVPGRSRLDEPLGPWVGSFTHVESDVVARDFVRMVLEVPGRQQRAIAYLAFVLDQSAKQIAEDLGIDSSTVRTVIGRLRKRFRAAHVERDTDRAVEQQVGRRDS